jgi:hypothetical protein
MDGGLVATRTLTDKTPLSGGVRDKHDQFTELISRAD